MCEWPTYVMVYDNRMHCRLCHRVTLEQRLIEQRICRWCKTQHEYLNPANQQDLFREDGHAVLHRASTASAS